MKVSVAEAKNNLTKLIKAVENGETVTIFRHGEPVVDMTRTKMPAGQKRIIGGLKHKKIVIDPDWWKPMSDEEVDELLGGYS